MMRSLALLATAPVWLPVLCLVGMATVACGTGLVVLTTVLKDRPTADRWMFGGSDLD